MAAIKIDGKAVAQAVKDRAATAAAALSARGITPCLAVILVGDDPASAVYVSLKQKACAACGIRSLLHALPADTTQEALLALIGQLNADPAVHGILCQMPVPPQINPTAVIHAIHPEKDVDAFHPENTGRILAGDPRFSPCTPAGVMALLDAYHIDPCGKHCVVVGRSDIVGKPMAILLLQRSGTVTVCHSKTVNLADYTRHADILVSAVGKAQFITPDMIKPGAAVIDVGMNRLPTGKLCGDVAPEAEAVAGWLTPVPGGCGPMTVAMLMESTVHAAALQNPNN